MLAKAGSGSSRSGVRVVFGAAVVEAVEASVVVLRRCVVDARLAVVSCRSNSMFCTSKCAKFFWYIYGRSVFGSFRVFFVFSGVRVVSVSARSFRSLRKMYEFFAFSAFGFRGGFFRVFFFVGCSVIRSFLSGCSWREFFLASFSGTCAFRLSSGRRGVFRVSGCSLRNSLRMSKKFCSGIFCTSMEDVFSYSRKRGSVFACRAFRVFVAFFALYSLSVISLLLRCRKGRKVLFGDRGYSFWNFTFLDFFLDSR